MDKVPLNHTLSLYAGDDDNLFLRWKTANNVAVDITGYTALLEFKLQKCGTIALQVVGIIDNPTTGEIIFPITGAEKEALIIDCQNTCYVYDVQMTSADDLVTTLIKGIANIEQDVTR